MATRLDKQSYKEINKQLDTIISLKYDHAVIFMKIIKISFTLMNEQL